MRGRCSGVRFQLVLNVRRSFRKHFIVRKRENHKFIQHHLLQTAGAFHVGSAPQYRRVFQVIFPRTPTFEFRNYGYRF